LSASPNALVTTIYHESGESISGSHPLPDITDPQKFGSAITYARRYSICAILSITADEDDDANTASDRNSNSKPQNSKPQSQGTISREEWLAKQNR
jgi:hypothetical protein